MARTRRDAASEIATIRLSKVKGCTGRAIPRRTAWSRGALCRRVSPITACPGEGRIPEPAAAAQAWPLEPVSCPNAVIEGGAQAGVSNSHTHTRWTPVDSTEIGLGGRERHVVVHCRLAEVLVASAPTCLVGMLPLNAALTSRLPPRSLIRQSPTGAPRRRRHHVASTRRDDH